MKSFLMLISYLICTVFALNANALTITNNSTTVEYQVLISGTTYTLPVSGSVTIADTLLGAASAAILPYSDLAITAFSTPSAGNLPLSGGTLTGNLNMSNNSINNVGSLNPTSNNLLSIGSPTLNFSTVNSNFFQSGGVQVIPNLTVLGTSVLRTWPPIYYVSGYITGMTNAQASTLSRSMIIDQTNAPGTNIPTSSLALHIDNYFTFTVTAPNTAPPPGSIYSNNTG